MRASRALLGALVGAQMVYGRLPERRLEGATRGIVGLLLAASLADAVEARGVRRGAGGVAVAGVLGFAAELAGVATRRPFGHYTYSGKLGPRVGGVPLLAAAAWAMMARPSWVVAGLLAGRRRALRVALAAGALTAWDVFLDPRMAREGYWSWPSGGRYEGVPASNFVGWFVTGAGVFAVWAALDRERPDARDDGALVLYAWTLAGETFASAVIWRRPRVAAAGSAAMAALGVPALVRRLRRS